MADQTVRVCVAGCGGVSASHLSGYQSHKLAAVILTAYRSIETGQTVSLPLDG